MPEVTRRRMLETALAATVAASWRPLAQGRQTPLRLDEAMRARAPARAVGVAGEDLPALPISQTWTGAYCRSVVRNAGKTPARVSEIVLFDLEHGLPSETRLYGEGFQMLTQSGGTVGQPSDLGNYTDPKHYRLPEPAGTKVVYGLLTLSIPSTHHVLGFGSCRRFNGALHVTASAIKAVIETEGLTLDPGGEWELEEFYYASGADRDALLDGLARRLDVNHPRLKFGAPPAGWCSWYCFGPRVTAQQVRDNLDVIAKQIPGLKYIQIDDGYQPAMGDWLETGKAFGGKIQSVLKDIRDKGFEPAIWVAPFIAEAGSNLFKQHPDWFVTDQDGVPLRADKVTFGGWRRGPWYALDGTHPAVQAHLQQVFDTMRRDWGCTYFKLDANFWGAIHGGRFHDPRATRIEAYRRGMEAVLRGTQDAFVLGCNHPIWASLGLIHGSRSSNDIRRDWKRIETTARQNLMRNWQNGRLWWNDPDAVVLTGELPEEEFRFHATAIYATGGMILSGDDLTTISPERLHMLRKLEPPTGVAARFEDDSLQVGVVDLTGSPLTTQQRRGRAVCLLNWQDAPKRLTFTLPRRSRVREQWTGEDLGLRQAAITLEVPGHGGRLLFCSPD